MTTVLDRSVKVLSFDIRQDECYAYCGICRDVLGRPKKIDRKGLQRHLRNPGHLQRRARRAKKKRPANKQANAQQPIEPKEPTHRYHESATPFDFFEASFPSTADSFHASAECPPEAAGDSDSDWEDEDSACTRGSGQIDDLFVASQEQGTLLPGASRSDDTSESSDSDVDSDSGHDHPNTYRPDFDKYISTSGRCDWLPWPSKGMFLADLITNSKRLRFTRRQTRALLVYARETGGRDVPSYKALRRTQARLKEQLGSPTVRKVSLSGNIFYMNRIVGGLAQDLANPYLRKHMNFYPHYEGKRMLQVWHGNKMLKSAPNHVLTPMIRHNDQIFYVNELVQRSQGWFLPVRWFLKGEKREMHAMGYIVKDTQSGLHICCDHGIAVPVSTFQHSLPNLLKLNAVPAFDEASKTFQADIPHSMRAIAGSRAVYSIPIILFMDDVSGNITKQWNKHISSYISNGALTREILNTEYSVRFVLTSKHATPSELMQGIREDLEESFRNPVVAFDCETQEEVLIQGYPLFSAADNPMQAEQCSCQLQNANFFCRTCLAGGSTEFKKSEAGYAKLFQPGEKRTPSQTKERVNALLDMSVQASQKTRIKDQAQDWGIKDTLGQVVIDRLVDMGQKLREVSQGARRRCESEVIAALRAELDSARCKGCVNAFLDMEYLGFNVHEDTPTEILHTVLLGVVKYFWGQTVFVLSKPHQMDALETRLGSVDISGLNVDSVSERYMCQYSGSLVGKHFKTLAQIIQFACYNLIQPDLFDVWLLLGRLTALLWYTEIEDIDIYLAELQEIIDGFLLAAARCSPSIIVHKPKFHFLVHLPMYIRWFGPAIFFSTECFESFHGVFRVGSLSSNHQSPSRDIADYFVGLDRLKHICSGGFWKEGAAWMRASHLVRDFIGEHSEFSGLLGLPLVNKQDPGSVVPLPRKKSSGLLPKSWREFSTDTPAFPLHAPGPEHSCYFHVLSIISQAGDSIKVGSNILFKSEFGQVRALFGCLSPNGVTAHYAAINRYQVSPTKHVKFDMPVLERTDSLVFIQIQAIVCLVNLQHDCFSDGRCSHHQVAERQEREDTTRTRYSVRHSNSKSFILNTQGLHNVQLIHRALPESLLRWRGLGEDPAKVRCEAVRKIASANVNKSLQAEARKAAKNTFNSMVESTQGALGMEFDSSKRPTKRRRTNRSTAATSATHADHDLPAPSVPTASSLPSASSIPSSYSEFWSQIAQSRRDTDPNCVDNL